jgi:hypothetical protein
MKKIFILVFLFGSAISFSQIVSWAQHGKGPQNTYGDGIAHDNNGGIYVTGDFRDSIRFGTLKITESNFGSPYCVKFDSLGNPVWLIKDIGGDGIVFDGGLYLYAYSQNTNQIKKIDMNGNVLFTKKTFTSTTFGSNGVNGMYATPNFFYVTGHFSGDAGFDNDTVYNKNGSSSSNWDAFVAKFNANTGVNVWASGGGGNGLDKGYGVFVTTAGNVYNAGYFKDTALFSTVTVTAIGAQDMYISQYDVNGNLQWIKNYGSTGFDLCNAIEYDGTGSIYAMGRFNTSITFGSTTLSGAAVNSFITKLDANGNPLWAKAIAGYEEGDLSYSNNKVAFTVSSSNGFTLSPFSLSSLGGTDILIGELDPSGNPNWAKIYGGTGNDEGSGITQMNGSVYFTGSFNNTASFDSYSFTSMASWDVVVAKLNPSLTAGLAEVRADNTNIKVYPNPATFTVNVSSPKEIAGIELYDISGKLILQDNNPDKNRNLNVSTLENGVYLLKVVSKEGCIRSNRIVISK